CAIKAWAASGRTSSAPGRTGAWWSSSTSWPPIPPRSPACTSGSRSSKRTMSGIMAQTKGGPPAADASLPVKIVSLVRYRFFLYAGLLPYLLGAAWARGMEREFHAGVFWLGFLGIFLSVVGVESFNEYFDARMGTDRVFNPSDDEYIPEWMFWVGVAAFAM